MNFTVNEIATITKTNKETVLRWIKAGKLNASFNSKKEGYSISSDSLKNFLNSTPKYKAVATENLKAIADGKVAGVLVGSGISASLAVSAITALGLTGITAVPVIGLPLTAAIGIAGGIGMKLLKKKKDVNKENFQKELEIEIAENDKRINELELELEALKSKNENLKQALGLDLDEIIDNLNNNL